MQSSLFTSFCFAMAYINLQYYNIGKAFFISKLHEFKAEKEMIHLKRYYYRYSF